MQYSKIQEQAELSIFTWATIVAANQRLAFKTLISPFLYFCISVGLRKWVRVTEWQQREEPGPWRNQTDIVKRGRVIGRRMFKGGVWLEENLSTQFDWTCKPVVEPGAKSLDFQLDYVFCFLWLVVTTFECSNWWEEHLSEQLRLKPKLGCRNLV